MSLYPPHHAPPPPPPPPPSHAGGYSSVSMPPKPQGSDTEIRLWETAPERRQLDELANLYSILKALDVVERAFSSDSVNEETYQSTCQRLIAQFRTTEEALRREGVLRDLDTFVGEYQVDCPRALERLRIGVPATVLHATGSSGKSAHVHVADTVQYFITAMDALKLEQRAKDEIFPFISDLMNSLTKVAGLPAEYQGRGALQRWIVTLNSMRASEDLSDEQVRQLLFDLDQAYAEFHRFLQGK